MEYFGDGKTFWFVLGFVFMILEIVTPGVFFLFFGLGAWLTLVIFAIFPGCPVWFLWVIFIVTSVASLVLLRQKVVILLAQRKVRKTDSLSEPMVAERFIGKEVEVLADILPGKPGTVEFNGTRWQAKSDAPLNTGARAKVIAVDDLTLVVSPL
jgi:membrane protein implicated in regulation of membrane protease activity